MRRFEDPGRIALAEVHLFRGEGKGDVLAVVGVHIGEKLLHFLQHVGTAVPGGFRGLPGEELSEAGTRKSGASR